MNNKVVTFRIKDIGEMKKLGSKFGTHFLGAFVNAQQPANAPVVVSLFGQTNSGKTLFAAKSVNKLFGREVLDGRTSSERKLLDNGIFVQRTDLGFYTHYCKNSSDELKGKLRSEWRTTACELDLSFRQESPSMYLIEHPSLPHLLNSDVAVVMGDPGKLDKVDVYLSRLKEVLQNNKAQNNKTNMVADQIAAVRDSVFQLYRETGARGSERVVSILLIKETEPARSAFNNFAKSTVKFNYPKNG